MLWGTKCGLWGGCWLPCPPYATTINAARGRNGVATAYGEVGQF